MTKLEIKKIETVVKGSRGELVTVATEWGLWVNGNLYSRHDTEAEATAEREYHASDNYYLYREYLSSRYNQPWANQKKEGTK